MRIRNMAIYFTAGVLCVYSMLRFYSGFMITAFCSRAAYGVEERGYVGTRYCIPRMRGPTPRQRASPSALPIGVMFRPIKASERGYVHLYYIRSNGSPSSCIVEMHPCGGPLHSHKCGYATHQDYMCLEAIWPGATG